MKILGYNKDYKNSRLFKLANNIKLDIALTKILEYDNFAKKLKQLFENNQNIKL